MEGHMIKKFTLQGNRSHIRLEQELSVINKREADSAFERYSKEILGTYLEQRGFLKWKTNAYVRRNQIDLLEYIDIQKERHGSKTFTVNVAIMPLYVPVKWMNTGFGDRLGEYIAGKDIWWDFADEKIAKISFLNVTDAVEKFVMPWFQKYNVESNYRKQLKKDSKKSFCGYDSKLWLEALDECNNRENVVLENIKALKLSKKLV